MTPRKPLPDQADLKHHFSYSPTTGDLLWKPRDLSEFRLPRLGKAWNSAHAGLPALACIDISGYQKGLYRGRSYYRHRIIWKLAFGTEPVEVDHLDGDKLNHRLANLRAADRLINTRNKSGGPNASAHPGVMETRSGTWYAYIGSGIHREYLGTYALFEAAIQARRDAEQRLGYTSRHGRAA